MLEKGAGSRALFFDHLPLPPSPCRGDQRRPVTVLTAGVPRDGREKSMMVGLQPSIFSQGHFQRLRSVNGGRASSVASGGVRGTGGKLSKKLARLQAHFQSTHAIPSLTYLETLYRRTIFAAFKDINAKLNFIFELFCMNIASNMEWRHRYQNQNVPMFCTGRQCFRNLPQLHLFAFILKEVKFILR